MTFGHDDDGSRSGKVESDGDQNRKRERKGKGKAKAKAEAKAKAKRNPRPPQVKSTFLLAAVQCGSTQVSD